LVPSVLAVPLVRVHRGSLSHQRVPVDQWVPMVLLVLGNLCPRADLDYQLVPLVLLVLQDLVLQLNPHLLVLLRLLGYPGDLETRTDH